MRRSIAFAVLVAGLAVAGCGDSDDTAPVACLEGRSTYLMALEEAPGTVLLDGEVPISDCLTENQGGGELATVGTAMLDTATELNAEARADPGGAANLELGYLIGAAQAGAEDTQGIHAELIRRLTAAARYSPDNRPLPAVFLDTYEKGFEAGNDPG